MHSNNHQGDTFYATISFLFDFNFCTSNSKFSTMKFVSFRLITSLQCGLFIGQINPSVHGGLLCPGDRFSACRAIKVGSYDNYLVIVIRA